MKMTMTDGTVFEGSMAEYMELLAFAERKATEQLDMNAEKTVLVYEPIVKAESKPKLKAGDFVKFEKDGKDITAGKAYKVEIADSGSLYVLDDIGIKDYRVGRKAKYEILSAEEVAKHRESDKWAKIGRKVNEFRKGDIISFEHLRPIAYYIVTRIENDRVYYNNRNHGNSEEFSRKDSKAINLVAPVEATLN